MNVNEIGRTDKVIRKCEVTGTKSVDEPEFAKDSKGEKLLAAEIKSPATEELAQNSD